MERNSIRTEYSLNSDSMYSKKLDKMLEKKHNSRKLTDKE